jgi:hypothetical protein
MRLKHLQKHLKIIANICNIHLDETITTDVSHKKHLKHLQHPDENTCNIRLIQMKHLEHTLETYMHSHCNTCNILIYFCNTDMKHFNISLKHLKHLKHIFATCTFSVTTPCCLGIVARRVWSLSVLSSPLQWRTLRRFALVEKADHALEKVARRSGARAGDGAV